MLTLRRIDESRTQIPAPDGRCQGTEGEMVQSGMPHEPHAEWKSEAVLLLAASGKKPRCASLKNHLSVGPLSFNIGWSCGEKSIAGREQSNASMHSRE